MERKSESVHTMLSLNLSLCIFSSLSEVSGVIELSLELSRAGLLGAPGLFDLQWANYVAGSSVACLLHHDT